MCVKKYMITTGIVQETLQGRCMKEAHGGTVKQNSFIIISVLCFQGFLTATEQHSPGSIPNVLGSRCCCHAIALQLVGVALRLQDADVGQGSVFLWWSTARGQAEVEGR
ncbi:hypothetical protein HaLaN_14893 [Haematococcus lacustris]|uniref:Uncharacterized protein n=1 Tax=Haematococcus lacustris TaxID=44745 RepID=A0A699ZQF2_HAELA|nr:hypothetical protein HaLaN_14893 [Haematococcus lacustris]